ncbi:endo-1,3;1,4-beta-D-glucanase-like isoform X5 [Prosopis cineraria]|uniref:endo-1,3;1,4-beta-D-glucanase-like isoform X5 n=1 Tax=Prosopis cineraria TaxID=364024 RepID=UPI0024109F39|nr:endo-1,3;1,4-beta-D-glucanase-like isoform X5 [Prosopis cineraria]
MSGPECCSNPPTFNPSAGAGRVEKVGGVDTYVSGSADFKLAILLISDVFGYEAPNLRKLADKVAAAGYFVVVPDFIHGDPFDAKKADRPLSVWVKDHSPDKGVEVAKPVIEALKGKGISAIGAAGFCWGGIEIPIAILGAGTDRISPPELVKQFEQILSAKPGVHSFVKIFPQVVHGWAVRYNTEDAKAVSAAEEAHQDLLSWFAKHVKYPRSRY